MMKTKNKPDSETTDDLNPVDRVLNFILGKIRTGEYLQGQPIVARNITKELNIHVAPVREALHRLVGEGVIDLHSNRSPRIKKLTQNDILNAIEVWEVNAGLTARLACEGIKIRNNAARVVAAMDQIRRAEKKRHKIDFFSAIIRFQEVLGEITENPYIEAVRKRLHTEFWTYQISEELLASLWEDYMKSFERIEAAILSGIPQDAEREYIRHLQWLKQHINDEDDIS